MHKPEYFRKILAHDVREITEKPLVYEQIFTVVQHDPATRRADQVALRYDPATPDSLESRHVQFFMVVASERLKDVRQRQYGSCDS